MGTVSIHLYCIWHEGITILNGNHKHLSKIIIKYSESQTPSHLQPTSCSLFNELAFAPGLGLLRQEKGLKFCPIFWGMDLWVWGFKQPWNLWMQMPFDEGKRLMVWRPGQLLVYSVHLGPCVQESSTAGNLRQTPCPSLTRATVSLPWAQGGGK